jgi:hypothetical protein
MSHHPFAIVTIGLALGAIGCGAPEKTPPVNAPETSAEPTSSPEVAPTSAPTAEAAAQSPRAKQTGLILKAQAEPGIDDAQKGRLTAVGLSEVPDYKLSPSWQRSLEAMGEQKIDPSQCERILRAAIDAADIKPAAEKRCGKLEALDAKLKAAKTPGAQAEALAKACKIDGVKATDKGTPWAVLTAALIEDELAAQPGTTADEKKMALPLRRVCE